MIPEDRGVTTTIVAIGLLLAVGGSVAIAGLTLAADEPSGEEILEDTAIQYENAETIVADGTLTVANDTESYSSELSVVTTDNNQTKVTVTTDDGAFVVARTDEQLWVQSPNFDGILRVEPNESGAPTLRVTGIGADLPQDANLSAIDEIDPTALNGSIDVNASQFNGDRINMTALTAHDGLSEEDLERINDTLTDQQGLLTEAERDQLKAINDRVFQDGEFNRDEFESVLTELQAEGDMPAVEDRVDEENVTVTRTGTTTINGEQAYIVSITHTERDGETRLWIDTETSEIYQQQLIGPNDTRTATVTITETQFNVSVAASTFEPPTPETEQGMPNAVDSLSALDAQSPVQLAVPGDAWSFEQGAVVQTVTTAVTAEYTNGDQQIAVVQTPTGLPSGTQSDGETVTVGDRTVTITETDRGTAGVWQTDQSTVIVAGDLTEDELTTVIESIEVTEA